MGDGNGAGAGPLSPQGEAMPPCLAPPLVGYGYGSRNDAGQLCGGPPAKERCPAPPPPPARVLRPACPLAAEAATFNGDGFGFNALAVVGACA